MHVLSGGFYATRLYRDLRENTGLVYWVDAGFQAGKTRSVLTVSYACEPANSAKPRSLIERNLRELQTKPVTPEEPRPGEDALPAGDSTVRIEYLLAIAGGLLERSLMNLPLDEPIQAAKRYKELTAAEVQAAFARWIKVDDFAEVVLGPALK